MQKAKAYDEIQQNCDDFSIQVLGAGGPEIDDGLASSSFLIWIGSKARIMVDAGGGSSFNFEKSAANFNDIEAILLTHLHVDHSAALPIYIKAAYFSGRTQDLKVYGPGSGGYFPATDDFIKHLFGPQNSVYPYLSDNVVKQPSTQFLIKPIVVIPKGKIMTYKMGKDLKVSAIDVQHGPVPALAWRVDYGLCSVTFSGDMNGSLGHLERLALNTNLLVANNAIPEDAGKIARFLHMRPSKIAAIAQKAHVKSLLLAHFMNRTKNRIPETLSIIKKQYPGTILLAKDLMEIEIDD